MPEADHGTHGRSGLEQEPIESVQERPADESGDQKAKPRPVEPAHWDVVAGWCIGCVHDPSWDRIAINVSSIPATLRGRVPIQSARGDVSRSTAWRPFEEITEILEEGSVELEQARELREEADEHLEALRHELDVGDGDIIEIDVEGPDDL
ncbi:hypothetical protein JCM18237_09830 [Halorubrum luteum]